MSVLEICQNAAKLVGVNPPTTLIDNSNVMAVKLQEHLVQAAKDRRRGKPWPQLVRTWFVDLTAYDANPQLPGDVMSIINGTVWDVNGSRPIEGPISNIQRANERLGIVNTGPFKKFHISGRIANKRLELIPSPTAAEDNAQIGIMYVSKTWLIPPMWTTGTTYAANTYCSNSRGSVYKTTVGGTTGATEPTWLPLYTFSDGGVQWTGYDDPYQKPMNDNDISLFDDEMMEMDVVWRMRKSMGMDYQEHKAEADRLWDAYYVQSTGAPVLRIQGVTDSPFMLNEMNIPDTGYGL